MLAKHYITAKYSTLSLFERFQLADLQASVTLCRKLLTSVELATLSSSNIRTNLNCKRSCKSFKVNFVKVKSLHTWPLPPQQSALQAVGVTHTSFCFPLFLSWISSHNSDKIPEQTHSTSRQTHVPRRSAPPHGGSVRLVESDILLVNILFSSRDSLWAEVCHFSRTVRRATAVATQARHRL